MNYLWGLPVALDLFFAGLGAGLFLVAVMADLFGGERCRGVRRVGGILAPWPVLLGILLLAVDLGGSPRFWEFALESGPGSLVLRPTSAMSWGTWGTWGTWLLVIFSAISLCYFVLSLVRWPSDGDTKLRRAVGAMGLPLGLLVTIYTGVLIAGAAIPLRNTLMLPGLLVGSAMLSGLATIVMLLGLRPSLGFQATNEPVMGSLVKGQSALALVVLALALVYVGIVAGRDGGAANAANAANAGSTLWWTFVVALGLAVPLVFGLVRSKLKVALATPAVAGLVVLGAFLLRYSILMDGRV